MALTSENGSDLIMPVQPMGYGGGNYGGGWGYPVAYPVFGGNYGGYNNGFGGDWSWIIILFLFAAMGGGWGNGFGGGFGDGAFPWLLNGQAGINANTNAGFDNAAVGSQLSAIQTSLNTGFSNAEVANCNRAMDAQATAYNNQIAALNRSFDAQTAVDNRLDTLDMNLQKCCCDNQLAVSQLTNTVQAEAAATRAAGTANTQAILDKLCQQEIDALKERNSELQTQVNMQNLAASQAAQTAALVADNTAQTQYIVNRVAPYPIPAYSVGNPYGYNGFGFNNGFNGGFNGCCGNFGGFNGNF